MHEDCCDEREHPQDWRLKHAGTLCVILAVIGVAGVVAGIILAM